MNKLVMIAAMMAVLTGLAQAGTTCPPKPDPTAEPVAYPQPPVPDLSHMDLGKMLGDTMVAPQPTVLSDEQIGVLAPMVGQVLTQELPEQLAGLGGVLVQGPPPSGVDYMADGSACLTPQ